MYEHGVPSDFGRHFPRLHGAHSVQRMFRHDFFLPLAGSDPAATKPLATARPRKLRREQASLIK